MYSLWSTHFFCYIIVGKYYISAQQTQISRGIFLHWIGTILLPVKTNAQPINTLDFWSGGIYFLLFLCQFFFSFQQSSWCSSNQVWNGHWEGNKQYYMELVKYIQPHIQMLRQGLIYFLWDINRNHCLKKLLFYMFISESLDFGCRWYLCCPLSSAVYWVSQSRMFMMVKQKVFKLLGFLI